MEKAKNCPNNRDRLPYGVGVKIKCFSKHPLTEPEAFRLRAPQKGPVRSHLTA